MDEWAVKIAAYLRVSTDRQVEGEGLGVQEAACRDWAKANGHRVVAVYSDEGISGGNGLDTRLSLADALEAIRGGAVKGIVVKVLDRLSRDVVLQEQLLAEIRRLGGQVFTTSTAEAAFLEDDPEDPSRRFIRIVLGAVNQYERDMIALRLRAGRLRKAAKGGYAYGSPAFGHQAVDGELVPVEEEQAVIRRIVELDRGGKSLRDICNVLEVEGYHTKRGGTWHPGTVSRILRSARPSAG